MNENETHFDLSDGEFEKQFACGSFNPSLFNHEAHLRLAWIHIDKYGIENAIDNVCHQLIAFFSALGEDKYNNALTTAATRAVYHFKLQSRSNNFQNFIVEFPELKYNFKGLVGFHYSNDIFNSLHAKQEYLEPDLIPFD